METIGDAVDTRVLDDLSAELGADADAARQGAWTAANGEPSSPKQLQEILSNSLLPPKTKKTKTGYRRTPTPWRTQGLH